METLATLESAICLLSYFALDSQYFFIAETEYCFGDSVTTIAVALVDAVALTCMYEFYLNMH